ncbi:MAG: hypothetical protein O6759_01375, partial [Candidatus Dadabacteria bacterium]|nr:hypothetical protein [Candidatus Dadabacteria bacterium]
SYYSVFLFSIFNSLSVNSIEDKKGCQNQARIVFVSGAPRLLFLDKKKQKKYKSKKKKRFLAALGMTDLFVNYETAWEFSI